METGAGRPDPDALLRRVQAEEVRASRAKLRVFFGFAPGVGKTYRMLQVAHALKDQGVDVVVGVVETHRRAETTEKAQGLPTVPRRRVEYRGHTLDELDLDGVLARAPRVVLIDELAHSNVEGSRHAKRWQDVLEILEAGIDVLSTVNVQHVESLNDVVAQITHVRVRETIPDSILDRADEVELVDIAPEALLERLREGKVYLGPQAERAAEHFFKRGNLLALRELALRRTAQRVDADVVAYREEHGVQDTWPSDDRIMVCVSAAPSSARLIRATARIAARLRCPWVAVSVETSPIGTIKPLGPSEAEQRLEAHLRLAESLGASVRRLSGATVADTVLDHARKQNVTRIVVGKPTHSRVLDRVRGSLLDELVRGSGDIDVHVISGRDDGDAEQAPRTTGPARGRPLDPRAYAMALGAVGATTAVAMGIEAVYRIPDLEMLYLLGIMLVAAQLGRGPAVLAAGASVLAYDFFFVPPSMTLAVSDVRYLLTFAMMFGVGIVVSTLIARMKDQEYAARDEEERTAALYRFSRELAAARDEAQIVTVLVEHTRRAIQAPTEVFLPDAEGALQTGALEPKDVGVARWCFDHAQPSGQGTDTLPGSSITCWPVGSPALAVLAIVRAGRGPLELEARELLGTLAQQASFALERVQLGEEARRAALRAEAEAMRSSLLSAVSHDLRTPLAVITGAATSLRDDAQLAPGTRVELLQSVCEEAERLSRLVTSLLDMTRLEAGVVSLKRDWVPLEELVGSALTRVDARLGTRPVRVELPGGLPMVSVDPVLFEQVLVNLLENVAKYTPAGSPVEILARELAGTMEIVVDDHGPGLPPGREEQIFEKFFRGPNPGASGVGLGLPIVRAIVHAHGGTVTASTRSEVTASARSAGGARFVIRLPVPAGAPSTAEVLEGGARHE